MIFSELDHRMSVVPRYTVVETIRKQNLATHSYNVTIIARRITKRLDDDNDLLDRVTEYALYHDYDETFSSDFPSYSKEFVNEKGISDRVDQLVDDEVPRDLLGGDTGPLVRFIVKCADYIDLCQFFRMEISLGNRSVAGHLRGAEYRFRKYVEESQGEITADAHLVYDWYQEDVVDRLFGGNGQYTSKIGFQHE